MSVRVPTAVGRYSGMVLSRIIRLLEQPHWRAVTNEYHNELVAENDGDLVRGHYAILQAQTVNAALKLRQFYAQEKLVHRSDPRLQTLNSHMGAFAFQMERAGTHIDDVDSILKSGFHMLDSTLRRRFDTIVNILRQFLALTVQRLEAQKQAADKLCKRSDIEAQDFLRKAEIHLQQGRRSEGHLRTSDLDEALRLFQRVVDNPIGDQNYVAWFNVGYLLWCHRDNPKAAEEAFFNAQQLSAQTADPWHTKSLRHLAEMQYLQGRYSEAHMTAQKGLAISREYPTLFNAARYAAKTGRKGEAESLLNEAVDMVPITIETMYGDEDLWE